jgi:heme/copper-type cytochrome/quinol oxidase subunit 2
MLDFIVWVAVISTGLSALVFLVVIGLIFASVFDHFKRKGNSNLPPPDKAAERSWSQKYFERAIGKK